MEWIQGMNAAVNYMEEHILEDPDLNELGKLAGCSAHHFQRIFTYIGGITLTEYIRKRRMSLAAVDLKDENAKVIDVAIKYGYDSPTAFNRAFQMIHGVTPTQARENDITLKAFPPLVFQMTVRGAQEMNYRIEKREAIRVIGKRIPLKSTLEDNFQITPRFWQECAMDGTKYYIAVASTKEADDFEELIVPESTWAAFYEEVPVIKMQELETRMDETFMLFLNDIPAESQGFVLELDKYLTEKGSKRTIKSAKSGFVTSYSSPKSGKALLNYVFRKTGVKIRIYAQNVGEYDDILSDFPDNMKKDIIKSGDCKKLNGLNCSPTCGGGYTFTMDGGDYKKCKNMAFFHSLVEENFDAIRKLIEAEIGI